MTPDRTSDLMTSREVAAYFRRQSTATPRRWHHAGKLVAAVELDNGELLWARADVEAFAAARRPRVDRERVAREARPPVDVATLRAQLDAAYARSVLGQGRTA